MTRWISLAEMVFWGLLAIYALLLFIAATIELRRLNKRPKPPGT